MLNNISVTYSHFVRLILIRGLHLNSDPFNSRRDAQSLCRPGAKGISD